MDPDVHIQQASVLRYHQREEDSISLRGQCEVVQHGHAVDIYGALARLDTDDGARGLSFSKAPSRTVGVQLSLTFFLGEGTTEIVQVDAVKFRNICQITGVGTLWKVHDTFIDVLGELTQVVIEEMFEERILLERME